jgi:hypothetical protein
LKSAGRIDGDGKVYVIDWGERRIIGAVQAGARPRNVAFSPDRRHECVWTLSGRGVTKSLS